MAGAGNILREAQTETAPPTCASLSLASSWEQRILQLEGKRYSLRLEHEFWTALEAIASHRKLRLNRLVADVASRRSGDGNLSSLLRILCLGEMEHRTEVHSPALDSASITALVEAAPAPGLVLDTDQIVLAANSAFFRWSGIKRALLLQQKLAGHFRLQSVSGFAGLWAGPVREEETRIIGIMPGRVVAADARLVPVLNARGRRLCVVWVTA
ncbi:MAG TPA: ribbon-helix-helix domain-containing protein [Stellaceae bacterium]|jgi:predicted DNA-binding ribbon-helix-helix protein